MLYLQRKFEETELDLIEQLGTAHKNKNIDQYEQTVITCRAKKQLLDNASQFNKRIVHAVMRYDFFQIDMI